MGLQHIDTSYQKESVYADTWGHLAPKKNTTYRGIILFSKSFFYNGNNPIIDFSFNNELESSPWLFKALENYIHNLDIEEGFVYKMSLTFRNYRLWGNIVNKLSLND